MFVKVEREDLELLFHFLPLRSEPRRGVVVFVPQAMTRMPAEYLPYVTIFSAGIDGVLVLYDLNLYSVEYSAVTHLVIVPLQV